MTTLVIATRNRHKVGEIQAILGPEFRCLTLNEFPDAPAAVEDGDTFAANATKKARALAGWLATRTPGGREPPALVLADDSGLEVAGLDGSPGVHSARFAALDDGREGNSPDAENNAKLLRLLADVPVGRRTARFKCVLALVAVPPAGAVPGEAFCFEGACEGRMSDTPQGANGFGYDPLFVPDGFSRSFAELGEETKNRLSHRAKALAKLKAHFQQGRGR